MLPDDHPDRIQIAFDDHRLVSNAGLILPSTLALHPGLLQLVDRHLDLGRAPGGANPGDKMMMLVASALGLGATASTTPTCCAPEGRPRPWLRGQGAVHPGNLPAQLPVGACPPAGSGEPGAAVPSLGCWCGPGRRAVDHRPGLHHLRDLRTGQGGSAPPRLYRPTGLSPAAGTRPNFPRARPGRPSSTTGCPWRSDSNWIIWPRAAS